MIRPLAALRMLRPMESVAAFAAAYGVAAIFAVMLLKEMGVPVPVPSDLLMIGAGVQIASGAYSWPELFAALGVAVLVGGSIQFQMRKPELLEKIKNKFGFRMATTSWEDVIAERCDIVVVGSPVGYHHVQTKAALEAGAHVLCEKPFTIDPADSWDLVEAVRRTGKDVIIAYGWNYRPMVVQAHHLMHDDGGIGEIEQMTIHMASATRELLSGNGRLPGCRP